MSFNILIIEDEPSIADNIRYALDAEGFRSKWCSTARDAFESLDEDLFHLIILDVGLPDQSGFEACKQIRERFSIPIIFLTARNTEIDRVVGLEIGADDYVSKPFSPRELVARIKAILRRTSVQVSAKTSLASSDIPFSIDLKRQIILFHNKSLELSRTEFMLLKVLIDRPGQVFSREQLMELAWEDPLASMDRTVDAHIKSIRSKLRQIDSEDDSIQTHRGAGYSLREKD